MSTDFSIIFEPGAYPRVGGGAACHWMLSPVAKGSIPA